MRIFLASTTDRRIRDTELRPKYVLETFFAGEKACKEALNSVENDNFLLDSGAFSFMSGQKCSKDSLYNYLEQYIDFINKNNVKYYFELDVDTIFGIEFVEQLRKKLERDTQRPCIPVWHKGRGVEYWKQMCDRYRYIAIGGLVFHVKKQEYELIRKMVKYAYDMGVKVHGLGFTKTKELDRYKFYSVDSTSWKMSAIRGQLFHFFDGKQIIQRKVEKGNKKADLHKIVAHNYKEWIKYQSYMDMKGW